MAAGRSLAYVVTVPFPPPCADPAAPLFRPPAVVDRFPEPAALPWAVETALPFPEPAAFGRNTYVPAPVECTITS